MCSAGYSDYMISSKPSGVIFDFNGVIVDDYPIQKQAWDQISLQLRNKPVTDDEMMNHIRGIPTSDNVKWMSSGNLLDDELAAIALKKALSLKLPFKT